MPNLVSTPKPVVDDTGSTVWTSADLLSIQILEFGAEWAIDIVILPSKAILSSVIQRVELVPPMAGKVEPARRSARRNVRRTQRSILIVVSICVGV